MTYYKITFNGNAVEKWFYDNGQFVCNLSLINWKISSSFCYKKVGKCVLFVDGTVWGSLYSGSMIWMTLLNHETVKSNEVSSWLNPCHF